MMGCCACRAGTIGLLCGRKNSLAPGTAINCSGAGMSIVFVGTRWGDALRQRQRDFPEFRDNGGSERRGSDQ